MYVEFSFLFAVRNSYEVLISFYAYLQELEQCLILSVWASDFERLGEILILLKAEGDRISSELRDEMLSEAIAIVEDEKSKCLVKMPDSVRLSKVEWRESEAPAIASLEFRGRQNLKCKKKLDSSNPEFDRFWNAVEKKLNKREAKVEFERLKSIDTDLLIAKIREHQDWHMRKNGSLKYMPNPARWLRCRRWEDELNY